MLQSLTRGTWYLRFFCVLCCFQYSIFGAGQNMEVSPGDIAPYTPSNLISDIFLGDGVQILDVQYSGNPSAVGFFDYGSNAVDIEKGILITTGLARKVSGRGSDGAQDNNDIMQQFQNEVDLQTVAPGVPLRNVAKYTIRFIPSSDTLRFNYVFASEEYPEFVCSEFNDVFGFFISGPGVNGPYENGGENIAVIPGTIQPVTINNVNGGEIGLWGQPQNCESPNGSLDFSHLYNDNKDTNEQPIYDGFTQVFTAEKVVIPCQEYTIKITIADVGDEGYDSGVFLEAKSFGTDDLKVTLTTVSPDGAVSEGCGQGLLTFKLSRPIPVDFEVDANIIGTALAGVDYEAFPMPIIIPAGEDSVNISINAFEDSIVEPIETLIVDFQKDNCTRDTVTVLLKDKVLVAPDIRDTTVCEGEIVTFDAHIPVQTLNAITFENNQTTPVVPTMAAVTSTINVTNVPFPKLRPGIIESVCVDITHGNPQDIDMFLVAPDGKFILLSSDNGAGATDYDGTCFSPLASESIITATDDLRGMFAPEGNWEQLWEDGGPVNGTWSLLLIDDEFGSNGILNRWSLTFAPPYQLYYEWYPADGLSCSDCSLTTFAVDTSQTYTVVVADSYGCQMMDTAKVTVNVPPDLSGLSCGTATHNAVTFDWRNSPDATGYEIFINGNTVGTLGASDTSYLIDNLQPGMQVDFGITPLGDCPADTVYLSCNTLDCLPPEVQITRLEDVQCFGAGNGMVQIEATGGSSYYDFTLGDATNQTGYFENLLPGRHTVEVLDDIGCRAIIEFTIVQPPALEIFTQSDKDVNCAGGNDGVATALVEGGVSPYAVVWGNGSSGLQVSNLRAGTHNVTVTDANGCVAQTQITISEPDTLKIKLDTDNVSCFGNADGRAKAQPLGGTPDYSYSWQSGENTASISNLSGGTYALTVTDANGCTATSTVEIIERDSISIEVELADVLCSGEANGISKITASGGTGTYSYYWNIGDTAQAKEDLAAGMYEVTVIDDDGCSQSTSFQIGQPEPLIVNTQTVPTTCFATADGSLELAVTGGTPHYTYNWADGYNSAMREDLPQGIYFITVHDENNCSDTLRIAVDGPDSLDLALDYEHPRCFEQNDGWISAIVHGGNGNYQYEWNQNANLSSADLTELGAGFYSLVVKDQKGCSKERSLTLKYPEAIEVEGVVQAVSCYGLRDGIIDISTAGGTGAISQTWFANGHQIGSGTQLSQVPAGIFQIMVTDENNCSWSGEFEVTQPAVLDVVIEAVPVSCGNRSDGEINLYPSGGTAPYQVMMGGKNYGTQENLLNLRSGTYDITVIDDNGCTFETSGIIIENGSPLTVSLGPDRIINFGDTIHLSPKIETNFNISEFTWSPANHGILSCTDCPNPIAKPYTQTIFTLNIIDEKGCQTEDRMRVFVKKDNTVYVPTAFSPNGDGNNDHLLIHGRAGTKVRLMRIFDRWGELVFEAKDFKVNEPQGGWDGTFRGAAMNSGVFVWYAEVEFEDGAVEFIEGSTTLIR